MNFGMGLCLLMVYVFSQRREAYHGITLFWEQELLLMQVKLLYLVSFEGMGGYTTCWDTDHQKGLFPSGKLCALSCSL